MRDTHIAQEDVESIRGACDTGVVRAGPDLRVGVENEVAPCDNEGQRLEGCVLLFCDLEQSCRGILYSASSGLLRLEAI
jgi:hypothetical protein